MESKSRQQNTASRHSATGDRPRAASGAPRQARAGASRSTGSVRRPAGRRRRSTGIEGILLKISDLTTTRKGLMTLGGGFLALIVVILLIGLISGGGSRKPDVVRDNVPVQAADQGEEAAATVTAESADTQAAPVSASTSTGSTVASTGSAATSSYVKPDYLSGNTETWRDGQYAPQPEGEGYLPIFTHANRSDKVIAITVDDCYQTENLRQIIDLALTADGKLTLFPIGKLLPREELQEVLRYAHEKGFEIENHTWGHDLLYNLDDTTFATRIFNQDRGVDLVLGVNYYTHFLRPGGGDDRRDLRTHSYLKQLGYYGIAHWDVDGKESVDSLKKALKPGSVYLFHCTDKDLAKLKQFIPYTESEGYKLLTLNELFGYEKNLEEPLTDDPKTREVIQLAPYEKDYKTISVTTYDYAVYEVQQKLIELGFMEGEPDGVYGKDTAASAAKWQESAGFKGDGVLTPEQQRKLFGVE